MDLGCIDMGCIEKQRKETFIDKEGSPKESEMSSSKLGKNKGSKDVLQSSLSALNKLRSQIAKPSHRRTSPLNWFPRKKVDSYLNRKIKLLQEVDGMNSTLDETLGDSNPHYSRVLREKIAIREAAKKAMEAKKAAMVEASWCRILKAARIESKDAEGELSKVENSAAEAFEAAKTIGVIMNDIPDCAQKRYKMETVSFKGGESTTHTISATFETAFEVDKQVAAAVKAAFIKLANCPSIKKDEFRELLRKVSETPDTDENYHELSEFSSECESDSSNSQNVSCDREFSAERKRKYKRRQVLDKFNRTNLVEMMLDRLRCLKEDELASLATIVATSGLNEALVEAENNKQCAFNSTVDDIGKPTSDASSRMSNGGRISRNSNLDGQMRKAAEAELPSLDKFLVKRLTKLQRELLEAKEDAGRNNATDRSEQDFDSKSDNEMLSLVNNTSPSQKDSDSESILQKPSSMIEENTEAELPSLDKFLVKRLTRLERELLEVERNKARDGSDQVVNSKSDDEKLAYVDNTSFSKRDSDSGSVLQKPSMIEEKTGEGTIFPDFGSMLVKHSSVLEKEIEDGRMKNRKESGMNGKNLERVSTVTVGCAQNANETTEVPSLDKYLVKHLSRLEREVQEARNRKNIEPNESGSITDSSKSITSARATDLEVISSCTDGDLVGKENMDLNQRKHGGNGDTDYESLDKVLVKHVTRLEKEKMGLYEEDQTGMKLKRRNTIREMESSGEGSLDQVLVKHKSRLEREKMAAAGQYAVDDRIRHSVSRRQARDRELQEAWGGLSLGNSMRPHISRLERDKDNIDDHISRLKGDKDGVDDQTRHSVSRRQARDRELHEAWGGLSLGNSMRPHISRLEKDSDNVDDQIKHSVSRLQAREKIELQEGWGGLSLGNSMRPHVSRLERDKAKAA
ncbi:hypothetical protein Fot_05979 [Forsythia ovata]|uniref:Uncharacterized protein n=1 Tax=Forsythia ovata TaxID=205694 RepID=A0ABD1WRN3_9LAMI